MKHLLFASAFIFIAIECFSQIITDTAAVQKTYSLGEVLISASNRKLSVTTDDIRKFHTYNTASSLQIVPSFVLSSFGSRNESTIYLHGFDSRSIPVFIDGIPVYVPYDGYVDLSRFTTFDVSRIDISKGFSPMSFGANTAGGVINLVSMKPRDKFELEARMGLMSGKGYTTVINAGSNLGKVYFQTGFSMTGKKYFRIPSSFDTTMYEKDHRRDNSASEDIRFSFKTGYTPGNGDEYSINYSFTHGEKGNPVYLGTDRNTRVRFWKWPFWDKQSVYYISRTSVGSKSVFKFRTYYDQFKNKLSSFDDQTYTTQNKKSSSDSFYDDHSIGGNAEFSTDVSKKNHLILSVHAKNDNHSEYSNIGPGNRFADNTFTAGIDDIQKEGKLSIVSGLSYNSRVSLITQSYNIGSQSYSDLPGNKSHSWNAQSAWVYSFSKSAEVNLSVAWKSRFATMKDRYSYRLGTGIPNPDLKPENALNLELSSSLLISKNLHFEPELFLSRLFNTIQLLDNVQEGLSQMQNTGNSVFRGIDLTIRYDVLSFLELYGTYSYIRMENLSNPEIRFTNVPRNKLFFSSELRLKNKLRLILFTEGATGSYSASDRSRFSPGYFTLNSNIIWHVSALIDAEAGIGNILDRAYSLEEGYPEQGRNFSLSLVLTMK